MSGKGKWILGLICLLLASWAGGVFLAFVVYQGGAERQTESESQSVPEQESGRSSEKPRESETGGQNQGDEESEQTAGDSEQEERLKAAMTVTASEITEDEYGTLQLAATVELPDYSVYFESCREEAEADTQDAAEFEEKLLTLTADAIEAEGGTQAARITKEMSLDLSAVDASKGKDDWPEAELLALVKEQALEEELGEFAAAIMADYLSEATIWDTETDGTVESQSESGSSTNVTDGSQSESGSSANVTDEETQAEIIIIYE